VGKLPNGANSNDTDDMRPSFLNVLHLNTRDREETALQCGGGMESTVSANANTAPSTGRMRILIGLGTSIYIVHIRRECQSSRRQVHDSNTYFRYPTLLNISALGLAHSIRFNQAQHTQTINRFIFPSGARGQYDTLIVMQRVQNMPLT